MSAPENPTFFQSIFPLNDTSVRYIMKMTIIRIAATDSVMPSMRLAKDLLFAGRKAGRNSCGFLSIIRNHSPSSRTRRS